MFPIPTDQYNNTSQPLSIHEVSIYNILVPKELYRVSRVRGIVQEQSLYYNRRSIGHNPVVIPILDAFLYLLTRENLVIVIGDIGIPCGTTATHFKGE